MKRGYKHTAVGVIPEEWDVPYLRQNLLQDATYGIVKAGTFLRSGIPMLRSGEIKGGSIIDDQPLISPEKSLEYSRTILKQNDVVIALVGYPGETAVIPDRLIGANISRAVGLLRPASTMTPEFITCYLNSPNGRKEFLRPSAGSAQIVVNLSALNKLRHPLPSLPEQRAIAQALGDIDALIATLDRLIAKKRNIKQAAMQQLLTGKIRLPGFSGKWEVKMFGDIVTKIVGGGTPSRANPAFWGNVIPWVTVKDFTSHSPTETQEYITRLGLNSSASHLIPAGTLIIATRIALGKAVVYDVDVAINQDLKALFVKSDIHVPFLVYWFENFGKLIEELGSGSTVKGVSLPELKRFSVDVPDRSEQVAIASILSDMDAELTALEARRAKTRALKQGMMQELLTGKTRLL